jgi:hypothetical protein
MARVFSWKLDDYKYGYIIPPKGNGPHISKRVEDKEKLSEMAETVKGMDKETYTRLFNELNQEVYDMLHVSISGSADDYYGNESVDSNYIILTGKDGANGKSMLTEEDLKKIEKTVTEKINIAKAEINAAEKSLKAWVVNKTNSTMETSMEITQESVENMNAINQSLREQLENAESYLNTAASLFDFNGYGITRNKIVSTISNSNSALTLASVANKTASEAIDELKSVSESLSSLQNEQSILKKNIKNVNDSMLTNIGNVKQQINEIKEDVENAKMTAYSQTASTENGTLLGVGRKKMARNENSPNSIITNVVQNGDKTYTSLVKIGDENYFINVLPSGETLNDENAKDGLTLSKTGFRYLNNGAEILISDGIIRLSGKNGNGSIEINDDGVFINGKKCK